MAKSLEDLLKLSRTQKNALHKAEILDILESSNLPGGDQTAVLTSISNLTTEIINLKKLLNENQETSRKQVDELRQQVSKQNQVIAKQQQFLEQLDRKERECNLVILGVPDDHETLEGATTDEEKLKKVWEKAGIICEIKSTKRLGQQGDTPRRRPVLAVVESRVDRDTALEKAKLLKSANVTYNKIYIKKDVHPSVREEWKRLREAFQREKDRPDNTNSVITFNVRERKVYKDNVVIDQWSMLSF